MAIDIWPREKNWKLLSTRSNKLHRAKQLGMDYPRKSESELIQRDAFKILFVCSMNQWRSPTAEKIYADQPLLLTRSRGTSQNARRSVDGDDLGWADMILVMEEKHKQRLLAEFPGEMRFKQVHVLDIPDNYAFMHPDLIVEITATVDPILKHIAG